MHSPQAWWPGLSLVAPSAPAALYYSLLLVCCRYRALLVCLCFYSVDIPDGENPEFLIKCKTLHMQGEILEGFCERQALQCPPLQEGALTTPVPERRQWTEVTYVAKLENVCNFLNIILDWPALFRMCVHTMYTDE